jgi:lipoate-protein ligase B
MRELNLLDLGLRKYQEVWSLQNKLVRKRITEDIEDTLILVEHFPVITLGKQAKKEEILVSPEYLSKKGINVLYVDRGGKITFHGPGQLVAYPILKIALIKKDIHWYIRNLERVIIKSLARLGIKGESKRGYTGVWVGEEKIASIGIGVKKWVTYHGLALNVSIDLSYFSLINSCGLDKRITSIAEILSVVAMSKIKTILIDSFCQVFERIPKVVNRISMLDTGYSF